MRSNHLTKRVIPFLFVFFFILLSLTVEAQEQRMISITSYPAYGEKKVISGKIMQEDGSSCSTLSSCRIVIYIQIADGQPYYVKPGTKTNNRFDTIKLQSDGSFFGNPYSNGVANDLKARYIHVLLVPASFIPEENQYHECNYQEALAVSIDHVTLTRGTDGSVTISPERKFQIKPAPVKKSSLTVSNDKIALDVDFYTSGKQGRELSESEIKKHLEILSPFTDTVRFYTASDATIRKAYKIAHEMGFQIIGTAWISGNQTKDKAEMDALIEYAKKGWIQLACVGSETQYAKLVSLDQLVKDIDYVKERVPEQIPVTTAETLGIVVSEAKLRNSCDVLFVNSYPIYEGVSIENAASHLAGQISTLQALSEGKQVMISETGYATSGKPAGNEKDAVKYFEDVRKWSVSKGIVTVFFMSADAKWKEEEDVYGSHWGILTSDLKFKSEYAKSNFFKPYAVSEESKPEVTNKKANNSITKVTSRKIVKYSQVKKKKVSFKISAAVKGKATLKYALLNKQKYITISSGGTVTLKKGIKKGTYKLKVQIKALETSKYYPANAIKIIKVVVK